MAEARPFPSASILRMDDIANGLPRSNESGPSNYGSGCGTCETALFDNPV